MEHDREEQIRQRAYEIWEREGRTEGSHEAHWQQAERELNGERAGAAGASEQSEGTGESAASAEREADVRPTLPGGKENPSPAATGTISGSQKRGG